MPRVFVSYSHKDADAANRLARYLEQFGVDVWIDRTGLGPGDSIVGKIQDALQGIDGLVALLSTSSVASRWVKQEIEAMLSAELSGHSVKVFPVVLDECDVPLFLASRLTLNLRDPVDSEAVARVIAEGL